MENKSDSQGIDSPSALTLLGCGLLMGGADAIPGVSGGTIALILGIYKRFIDALGVVVKCPQYAFDPKKRTSLVHAFAFLMPLGIGVLTSYFLATKILVGKALHPGFMLRAHSAPICYGFFFGLVLFSIKEPWKKISIVSPACYVAVVLGFFASFLFVGLPKNLLETSTWILLFAGAGAIAMMLLPGVSGSLFLVIIGQYTVVAGAVHERAFSIVLIFLVGMGLGVLACIPTLKYLLRNFHSLTMAALTGLMAGSLRALWPWKTGYNPKTDAMLNQFPNAAVFWTLVAFCLGAISVIGLGLIEKKLQESPA